MRPFQATLVALGFLILLTTSLPLENHRRSLGGLQDASVRARGHSLGADERDADEHSLKETGFEKREEEEMEKKNRKKFRLWKPILPPKPKPGWRTLGPS